MVSKTPLYVFDWIDAHCCVLMCFFCIYNASNSLNFRIKTVFVCLITTQTKRLTESMFNKVFSDIVKELSKDRPQRPSLIPL